MKKHTITIIAVIILQLIISCTVIMIVGKDNEVKAVDPVGVTTKVDSVDILDESRHKTIQNIEFDTIK